MDTAEIITTIVQEFPYALAGSVLVGMLCGYLGVYIVARRVVFLGGVLTQVSVFGIALTFLPFIPVSHTVGSLAVTLAAAVMLSRLLGSGRVPRDAVLGTVFAGAIAVRILLMQKTPKVEVSEIENLLRGDILFVTPETFWLMAAVFAAAIAVHLLFFRQFTYVSFDAETARTQGFRAAFWDMLFYVIAAVAIAVATHMVGDVFVFGFLVIPPVAAMLVSRSVKGIFLLSVVIGCVAPVAGLLLAFVYDFPASPAMIAVALGMLAGAAVVRFIGRH
jgi:ABC-type Mn2+/Zn2+ transport system permease subunit